MKKIAIKPNFIYSLVIVLTLLLVMGFVGDYFFEENDDVLIKDIISGAYTGTPEGHNMQLLYPISFIFSLFYSVIRGVDWYGFFLCAVPYLCVFLISVAGLKKLKINKQKVVTALFILLFSLGIVGAHFLFIQYTFTCGFMSATAAFLILMHERNEDRFHVIAFVLLSFAFMLRSEMLLLTFPMVLVAVLIKWITSKEMAKEFKGLLGLIIAVAIAALLGYVINMIALGTPKWNDFTRFFKARTELYDFQPGFVNDSDYEDNKDFYDSIGLDKSEVELLKNYNFGLDNEIDADCLSKIAEYAKKQNADETPFIQKVIGSIKPYLYNLRHFSKQTNFMEPQTDYPWNLIVIVLYLGVVIAYVFPFGESSRKENIKIIGLLAVLFACRTSLWLYLIAGGRVPIRISHPLYLVESMILLAMLLNREKARRHSITAIMVLASLLCIIAVPNQAAVIKSELASRELMREHYDALDDYFRQNKDKYYFVDVYTSVSCGEDKAEGETGFSEKLFENVDNSYQNHDIMGGWACKSPLYDKKMKKAGFDDMQSALLKDKVFFVQNKSESFEWLIDYYENKGVEVIISREDIIAGTFAIYSLGKK